jgi:hypothetical protein
MSVAIHKFPFRPELMELLTGLIAAVILVAIFSRRPEVLRRIRNALRRTTCRRFLWIVIFALLGPSIRLALIPLAPVPVPTVHDEFVELLAADTLLHGRLANPPHPFSDHFETIYVLQKPTYSASYPLGTAAFLAAGWKLTGQPWFGVWMAMVLCCGAVAWMQYQWLPPVAAWTGAMLCSLALGISPFWMNSYYGGEVSAAGGALLLGALRSLVRTGRLRDACILSAGWTLIWFTRPYESLILGAIAAASMFGWLGRKLWSNRASLSRMRPAIFLIAAVVVLDFGGFCYHNWRVTGEPLLHPYQLSQRLYGVPHAFLWQKEIPQPASLTPQQQRVYLFQQSHYRAARSLVHRWPLLAGDFKKIWALYLGYPLSIPLLIGLLATDRRTRLLQLFLGISIAWSMLYPRILPNYLAAVTGLFIALAAYGLVRMARWRPRGQPWGAALAMGLCLASILSGVRVLYAWYLFGGPEAPKPPASIARQLEADSRSHLVFVRYGPDHNLHHEWVYNRADIDHAKVVWANDLGDERNRQLIQFLAGRQVWLVEPDNGARLEPYSP